MQLSELCGRRRCWACQQGELLQGVGTGVAPCTRQVPELPLDLGPRGRDALGGGDGEAPAAAPRLRRKGHAVDVTRVQALEVEASLAGGDVEEGGGVVVRGEGEEVAVGGEGDAVDVIRVEALQMEASLASPGVEEGGGVVLRGEGERHDLRPCLCVPACANFPQQSSLHKMNLSEVDCVDLDVEQPKTMVYVCGAGQ